MGLPIKILIALGALVAAGLLMRRSGDTTGPDARRMVGEGARLLDVRTPGEFETAHLPGAINIPVQVLAERLGELEPKDQPIVVYCRSGNRSGKAKRMLAEAGFASVHDLGSMSAW